MTFKEARDACINKWTGTALFKLTPAGLVAASFNDGFEFALDLLRSEEAKLLAARYNRMEECLGGTGNTDPNEWADWLEERGKKEL